MQAALELFAAKGFDGTSTRAIAQAAGVAESLIFHHFDSKESLLAAVFETNRSYFGELQRLSAGPADLPVESVLTDLAEQSLRRLRQEGRIAVVLFSTAQTNREMRARLEAVVNEGTGYLAHYLKSRMTRGELRGDLDVEAAAFAFLSPLFLFFLLHRDRDEDDWERRSAEFVDGMVSTWLDGARGRVSP